jgi:hypothetical protein
LDLHISLQVTQQGTIFELRPQLIKAWSVVAVGGYDGYDGYDGYGTVEVSASANMATRAFYESISILSPCTIHAGCVLSPGTIRSVSAVPSLTQHSPCIRVGGPTSAHAISEGLRAARWDVWAQPTHDSGKQCEHVHGLDLR